jgi:PAS domain S-box-containing protein
VRTIFLLGLILALGCKTAAADPRLRIGVEIADQPISFLDAQGRPTGFTAELIKEMGRAGLTNFEIVPSHWTNLIREFQAGRLDVLANVALTEERLQDMDFSVSHAYVHGIVYSRRDRPPIETTADFPGKTIGTLSGSISLSTALAHGGWGAKIVPFASPQAALDAVQNGGCDAALLIYGLEGKYVTNSHGLRRGFVDDMIYQFRFAVHRGDAAALRRLNDALATVRHNGTFDRVYDQWIGPIEPHPIRLADLRPYAQPIALGLVALAAIFWWQRRMLAHVSQHARALRESEERFRGLVDSAFEGWVIHESGRIVLVNATYASTFGYSPAELTGRNVLDLTPPEARSFVEGAIAAGRTTPYETLGLRKDGTHIPIEVAGQACTFDGKPARIAAVRDLSQQKRAASDQLILSKLESTGILAGGIAHDFNNLLATMVLNVDMALTTPGQDAEQKRYLQAAKHAALSAKSLTQQLVTFAQGGSSLRQPTDLAALLGKIVPLSLSGSNVRAEIACPEGLWFAEIDASQIERAVSNLVLNAREAMPGGGVVTCQAENVSLRAAKVAALPSGEYVRITITDQGRGIPADVLPKIFDPYFSTKQRGVQKGMGLGLTISHSVVHQQGGALTVESSPTGTTFHLFLPATRRAPVDLRTSPIAVRSPTARVLVMDDEPALRDAVHLALESEGYTVATAADGEAALILYEKARQEGRPFDAVVLDLTVRGGMGGLETMQKLRALDPAVRGLVMSGYAQETVLRDYARHGFGAALTKPFDLAALRGALAQLLAG